MEPGRMNLENPIASLPVSLNLRMIQAQIKVPVLPSPALQCTAMHPFSFLQHWNHLLRTASSGV
eukprot:CAMPEP_0184317102 /NCGR_PEP_ID=MMETSP1049-20130417/94547_1 /TAXON_ID=77928 /ORGANISM="Proteomonas sulcata, Strain CCMP704" /LENGTH=63 /DNA_ID=CAMNT_0026636351 /DNA_START=19 /DNA_END=207 /DNA_ORIENTATION=+